MILLESQCNINYLTIHFIKNVHSNLTLIGHLSNHYENMTLTLTSDQRMGWGGGRKERWRGGDGKEVCSADVKNM